MFFSQFSAEIDNLTKGDKKKRQYIYQNHFVRVFKDLIRYGYPRLAFKVYYKYRLKCGFGFWKLFLELCFAGTKERIAKITNKN
jgi:hypothetical protein